MQLIKNVTNNNSEGALNYNKPVVIQIVDLATKEIAGVASFAKCGRLTTKNSTTKKKGGLAVTYLEDGIVVDLFINILFGYSVNDVAYKIQENVKRSVESMTEFKIKHINVHITGVLFENMEGKFIL